MRPQPWPEPRTVLADGREPDRLASRGSSSPGGLIFGLIRMRSSAFSGVRISAATQVTDGVRSRRTRITRPENRKVDGSTPSLATTSDQHKWSFLVIFCRSLSN
jgi:hypothetical protein